MNPVYTRVTEVLIGLEMLWENHGTKYLGTAAAIVAGVITIPDLIPADHHKWWSLANVVLGVLTLRRGYTNSKRQ